MDFWAQGLQVAPVLQVRRRERRRRYRLQTLVHQGQVNPRDLLLVAGQGAQEQDVIVLLVPRR